MKIFLFDKKFWRCFKKTFEDTKDNIDKVYTDNNFKEDWSGVPRKYNIFMKVGVILVFVLIAAGWGAYFLVDKWLSAPFIISVFFLLWRLNTMVSKIRRKFVKVKYEEEKQD